MFWISFMRHRMLLYAKLLSGRAKSVWSEQRLLSALFPTGRASFIYIGEHEARKKGKTQTGDLQEPFGNMADKQYSSVTGAKRVLHFLQRSSASRRRSSPFPYRPGTWPVVAQGRHLGALLLLRQVGGGKPVSLKKPQRPLFPNQQITCWRNLKRRKPRAPSHPHTAPWRHSCGSSTINHGFLWSSLPGANGLQRKEQRAVCWGDKTPVRMLSSLLARFFGGSGVSVLLMYARIPL